MLNSNKNILGFAIDGKIDKTDMVKVTYSVLSELKSDHQDNIYLEISNLDEITWSTLLLQLKYNFQSIPSLGKLRRVAVVSDQNWMRELINLSEVYFEEIKPFSLSQRREALQWLQQ